MAREKNDAVGCAFVSFKNTKRNPQVPFHYMLTCHYAETNFLKETVYDHGEACSRCNSYKPPQKCDINDDYHRLCQKTKEKPKLDENSTRGIDRDNRKMCHESNYKQALAAAAKLISRLMALIVD